MNNVFLGIDFGEKFVGLALAEPPLYIAFPYKVLEYKKEKQLILQLLEIIEKKNIKHIVVGWPISFDEKLTRQTEKTEKFIKELKKYLDIPISIFDERLTSKGIAKENHDSSAALILERWIEKEIKK